ncbi:MAG: hypothetical protein IPI76_01085 [Chloracidobacterium sp.]|nr:hypothetical protein [Chloracidobacterium sp.]
METENSGACVLTKCEDLDPQSANIILSFFGPSKRLSAEKGLTGGN